MWLDSSAIRGAAAYRLLIDTIIPRPVAWIGTWNDAGLPHLAPFSFFNGVCARPPTISVAIAPKPAPGAADRSFVEKDTLRFIRRTRSFVVHLADRAMAPLVDRSAEDLPEGTDVFAEIGFTAARAERVDAPRIQELPVALECRLAAEVAVGDPPTTLVLAEVHGWHVPEAWIDGAGRIHWEAFEPVGRLGVAGYR